MSVIVYDPRKRLMVSDTKAYSGSSRPIGYKSKIYRVTMGPFAGSLLGVTSNQPGVPEAFAEWVSNGMNKEDYAPSSPLFDALMVKPDGEIFFFNDSYYMAGPLRGDVFAIGSGAKYALGAFEICKDAFGAVRVAIKFDGFCDEPMESVLLDAEDSYKAGELHG